MNHRVSSPAKGRTFATPKYRQPWHTVVWHDRLEGLPPKVFSNSPGYYYTTRLPKSLNPCETISRVYFPPTATLISRVTGRLGLHAAQPRLYQPFP
jgi:hypothetical protein